MRPQLSLIDRVNRIQRIIRLTCRIGDGEHGAGLLYAIIFASVVSIIAIELYRRGEFGESYIRTERLMSARESLARRLSTISGVDDALYQSFRKGAGVNANLVACLSGAGCASLLPTKLIPFSLYDATGTLVAGGAGKPVLYDGKAQPCAAGGNCYFAAYAYFFASCPAAQPVCVLPEKINSIVQIRYVGKQTQGLPASLADLPTNSALAANAAALASTTFVQNILRQQRACPAGSVLVQTSGGALSCACTGTRIGTDGNGLPICSNSASACATGQIFTGIDGKGTAQCINDYKSCTTYYSTVTMNCNSTTCTQLGPLVVNCHSTAQAPKRLTGVQMPQSSNSCNSLNDPSKKSSGPPTSNCTLTYHYTCCG